MIDCCEFVHGLKCEQVSMHIDELETENAKLRKLVQYIVDECYGDEWFYEQAESLGIEPDY